MPRPNPDRQYSQSGLLVFLVVRYILAANAKKGCTYDAIASVLNYKASSVYRAVAQAEDEGLLHIVRTGRGRGVKAIIYPAMELTWEPS
jgi:predicted transcriptional regulator